MRGLSSRLLPLVVGTIGLVACSALLVTLAYRHNVRLDLTPQQRHSLSPLAKKILHELRDEVRITVFVRTEDPRTPALKDLLWQVGGETPRVRYDFVDLNRSPATAREYDVDRYGAVVVESNGRRRDVANPSEALLLSAVLEVTRERQRVAYFVTGHGERAPTDSDRKQGYSTARFALEDEAFLVRELPVIGSTGVPPDATVVIVAGPRREYLPDELEQLRAYVARGGDLLLLLDPEAPPSIVGLAAELGIEPRAATVVDPERRLAAGEGVTFQVASLDTTFLVSRTLEAPPALSSARPLEVEEDAADAVAFLRTSAASYTTAGGGRSPAGAVTVAAARRAASGDAPARGRVIVIGDSDFASNALIDYLGNKDLLLNSANWLAREEALIATRAQRKAPGREQFFVTAAESAMVFWIAAIVQPGAFLLVGAIVFARRRMR